MKIFLCFLMIVLLLLSLCACHQEEASIESQTEGIPSTSTTSSGWETTESSVVENSTPPTTEASTTESIPSSAQPHSEGRPLDEEEISWYQDLFVRQKDHYAKHPKNWYNVAMCMEFDAPENIDWNVLFYNGTGDEDEPLTADEQYYLEQMGFPMELDIVRLSPKKMDEIAQQYFGVTLDSSNQVGLDNLTFFPQTGCYYRYVSDTMSMSDFTIYEGYILENGDIRLYYTDNILQWKLVITLRSKISDGETGYYIISNLFQE